STWRIFRPRHLPCERPLADPATCRCAGIVGRGRGGTTAFARRRRRGDRRPERPRADHIRAPRHGRPPDGGAAERPWNGGCVALARAHCHRLRHRARTPSSTTGFPTPSVRFAVPKHELVIAAASGLLVARRGRSVRAGERGGNG